MKGGMGTMTNEMRNPQLGDRGFTIKESLEALKKLYPVSPSGVNGKCSDCCHFRQVHRVRSVRTFCRFSGEKVSPDMACNLWNEGGESC